jgi:hypothetical protein
MNLHQVVLTEMTGPVPYELTLGEIIRDGDVSNPYQTYVLSLLSQFFKNGPREVSRTLTDGPVPISSDATSVASIESIKSLTPSDKVNLAQYLLDAIKVSQVAVHGIPMSSNDWIQYVLRRNQD